MNTIANTPTAPLEAPVSRANHLSDLPVQTEAEKALDRVIRGEISMEEAERAQRASFGIIEDEKPKGVIHDHVKRWQGVAAKTELDKIEIRAVMAGLLHEASGVKKQLDAVRSAITTTESRLAAIGSSRGEYVSERAKALADSILNNKPLEDAAAAGTTGALETYRASDLSEAIRGLKSRERELEKTLSILKGQANSNAVKFYTLSAIISAAHYQIHMFHLRTRFVEVMGAARAARNLDEMSLILPDHAVSMLAVPSMETTLVELRQTPYAVFGDISGQSFLAATAVDDYARSLHAELEGR